MYPLNPQAPCTQQFQATLFIRHHRMLRAVLCDGQAWFCLADLARLMGTRLDERATLKLDPDQRRTAWLEAHAEWEKCLLVSESGMFALLVHHYVPENRTLRQWMTHQVLPELHQQQHAAHDDRPSLSRLNWMGNSLHLLHWRNESWVRWQDVPQAVLELPASRRGWWQRMVGKVLNKGEALRIG